MDESSDRGGIPKKLYIPTQSTRSPSDILLRELGEYKRPSCGDDYPDWLTFPLPSSSFLPYCVQGHFFHFHFCFSALHSRSVISFSSRSNKMYKTVFAVVCFVASALAAPAGLPGPKLSLSGPTCPPNLAKIDLGLPAGQTALAPQKGVAPSFALLGVGVQNYTCADTGKYA